MTGIIANATGVAYYLFMSNASKGSKTGSTAAAMVRPLFRTPVVVLSVDDVPTIYEADGILYCENCGREVYNPTFGGECVCEACAAVCAGHESFNAAGQRVVCTVPGCNCAHEGR